MFWKKCWNCNWWLNSLYPYQPLRICLYIDFQSSWWQQCALHEKVFIITWRLLKWHSFTYWNLSHPFFMYILSNMLFVNSLGKKSSLLLDCSSSRCSFLCFEWVTKKQKFTKSRLSNIYRVCQKYWYEFKRLCLASLWPHKIFTKRWNEDF